MRAPRSGLLTTLTRRFDSNLGAFVDLSRPRYSMSKTNGSDVVTRRRRLSHARFLPRGKPRPRLARLSLFFFRTIFTLSPVELHSCRRGAMAAAAGVAGAADINKDRSLSRR